MFKNPLRWGQRTRLVWYPRLLGLLIIALASLSSAVQPSFVQQAGNLMFDQYQKWKPRTYHTDIPVRVIDIDNESIARIGQWPWSRLTLAEFNNRLNDAGAAVMAYDIIFSEADRTSPKNIGPILAANPRGNFDSAALDALLDHDRVFANALGQSNSVLGFFMLSSESDAALQTNHSYGFSGSDPTNYLLGYYGVLPALAELGEQASGEGFVSFQPGSDSIVRNAPLFQRIDDRIYPSLSMEALRTVQGAQSYILRSSDGHEELGGQNGLAAARIGDFTVKTDENGRFPVYYASPSAEIRDQRIIPAWKIMDGSASSEWVDKIAGNIVFIGTSAEGLKDLVATPLAGAYEGVGVHAEIMEQIIGETIHGDQILQRPYWASMMELFAIIIPGLLLVWMQPRLGAGLSAVFLVTTLVGLGGYSWYQFSNARLLINPAFPMLTMSAAYLFMTIVSFWLTEVERSQIRGAFSRYLSPKMVAKVSDDPDLLKLGGEERDMTILFLDIRSFSKISEGLEPQEIVTFLNLFLTPMTEILQAHNATIDKYIGDAIVAFWNAPLDDPDHENNACAAVLAMNAALVDLCARYDHQDEIKWPENLSMGIGLNTGICCVGNLGSEQRFSYSMIGDAANLASRIEGMTKQYGVDSLMGDSTAIAASDVARLEADLIKVVGRQTPERIWVLIGPEAMAQSPEFKAFEAQHAKFLSAYRAQDWTLARQLISAQSSAAKAFKMNGYYAIMEQRIAEYETREPIPDWDGVYVATSK